LRFYGTAGSAPGDATWHRTRRLLREQGRELSRRQGYCDQESLHLLATFLQQQLDLMLPLDPFSNYANAHRVAHAQHRADDLLRAGLAAQIAHERAIDLEFVEAELLQVGEARITGAEIIHC